MIIEIPETLYKDKTVHFPENFKNIYLDYLKIYNVYDLAIKNTEQNVIGGDSDNEALTHFALRFQTSGSRNEYFCLDPDGKFQKERNQVLISLGTGNIGVLDVACGTGGSTLAMLTTLSELRKNIPFLPLNLNILAIDYSKKALEIYQKVISEASNLLLESGIKINIETQIWNATDPSDTTNKMDYFLMNKDKDEYFVMINNFSGAINEERKLYSEKEQELKNRILDSIKSCIIYRISQVKATLLWIEPSSNESKRINKFLNLFWDILVNIFPKLQSSNEIGFNFKWFNFITNKTVERGSITLNQFHRD